MFNAKACGIAAGVGFVLSFIIGLCCGVRFGHVILRAFLFAILCGGICFGAMFVFKKFLKNPVGSEDVEPSQEDNENAKGSMVDITIGEDSLPDDASEPSFFVNSTVTEDKPAKQEAVFTASTVDKLTVASANSIQNTTPNVSSDSGDDLEAVIDEEESVAASEPVKAPAASVIENNEVKKTNKVSESTLSEDLDQLPDFGDMASGFTSNDVETEDSKESLTSPSVSYSGAGSSGASVQDADVVAQAIRTMLNGD